MTKMLLLALILPCLPPGEAPDPEVATNLALRTMPRNLAAVVFQIDCDANPTHEIALALGTDADEGNFVGGVGVAVDLEDDRGQVARQRPEREVGGDFGIGRFPWRQAGQDQREQEHLRHVVVSFCDEASIAHRLHGKSAGILPCRRKSCRNLSACVFLTSFPRRGGK